MSLEQTATKIESVRKITAPIWGLIVGLLTLGYFFGRFYQDYTENATNGSPALRSVATELRRANDLLEKKVDLLEQQTNLKMEESNRRLDKLEK